MLYNGNGEAPYQTIALSGVIGDGVSGFGLVALPRPANSIEHGSPDGVALVDNYGRFLQFLSYEVVMTATPMTRWPLRA